MHTTKNKQTIEVVTVSEERRRRWSTAEKAALVRETYEPGMPRKRYSMRQYFPAGLTSRHMPPPSKYLSPVSLLGRACRINVSVRAMACPVSVSHFAHSGDTDKSIDICARFDATP